MAESRKTKALNTKLRKEAAENGILPHEFLLQVTRGESVRQRKLVIKYYESGPDAGKVMSRDWVEFDYYPDFTTRMSAAKAAASYYAPRMATQTVTVGTDTTAALTAILKDLADELPS